MKIVAVKESDPCETRAAILPGEAQKLIGLGAEASVEAGLGLASGVDDEAYRAAGAAVSADRAGLLRGADMVLAVEPLPVTDLDLLQPGTLHVSFLDPRREGLLLPPFGSRGISVVSMDRIPRITRAQGADALSSQASLAGYAAIIFAARHLKKIFPMMITAAGVLAPARVLVLGAGVAGLQAIATARRLGATVHAYDPRPATEDEIRSLGGRPISLELGEDPAQGPRLGPELNPGQQKREQERLADHCSHSDVIVTAAQVFGRTAPILVTESMLDRVRPGSVVVDCAVSSGGNVAGLEPDRIVERRGITLVSLVELSRLVPADASRVYSRNLLNFISMFWDKSAKRFAFRLEDEILRSSLVCHDGRILQTEPAAEVPAQSSLTNSTASHREANP